MYAIFKNPYNLQDNIECFAANIFTQSSNEDKFMLPDVQIREITKTEEKIKWLKIFIKSYTGDKDPINKNMTGELCRYFLASVNGKSAGYIRITNYTYTFKDHYEGEVWAASDAFVKPPYRSQLVLRSLLEYVIKNCNVKVARLETDRLETHRHYYQSLGLTYTTRVDEGFLSLAMKDEVKYAFKKYQER